jgi:hypothetical protein
MGMTTFVEGLDDVLPDGDHASARGPVIGQLGDTIPGRAGMSDPPRSLVELSRIRQALAKAGTLEDVAKIRDTAVAFHAYAKARGEGIEIQNEGAEIVLRAERQAGELLARMEKAKGGRPKKTGVTMTPVSSLEEQGISKNDSKRWQRIAAVPAATFDAHIAGVKEAGRELTRAGVYRLAREPSTGAANGHSARQTITDYTVPVCEGMKSPKLPKIEVAKARGKAPRRPRLLALVHLHEEVGAALECLRADIRWSDRHEFYRALDDYKDAARALSTKAAWERPIDADA